MRHFRASLHSIHFMRTFNIQAKYKEPFNSGAFFLCPVYHINNLQLFLNTSLTNVFFRLINSKTFTSQQCESLHMHKRVSWLYDLLKQNFVCISQALHFYALGIFLFPFGLPSLPGHGPYFARLEAPFVGSVSGSLYSKYVWLKKICHSILQDSNSISAHTTDVLPVS